MSLDKTLSLKLHTIDKSATVAEAAQYMKAQDTGAVLVREGDDVVGLVTDRDIVLRAVAEGLAPADAIVEKVMTKEMISCRNNIQPKEVAAIMRERGVRRLLVLDDNDQALGLISLEDVAERLEGKKGADEVVKNLSES